MGGRGYFGRNSVGVVSITTSGERGVMVSSSSGQGRGLVAGVETSLGANRVGGVSLADAHVVHREGVVSLADARVGGALGGEESFADARVCRLTDFNAVASQ